MNLVPFKAEHVKTMLIQSEQQRWLDLVSEAGLRQLEGLYSYSIEDNHGQIILSGGVQAFHAERGLAWAYLAEGIKYRMTRLTRIVRRFLDACPHTRLEMWVRCDFEAGHRWAQMLGFDLETPRARKGLPDGEDCSVYVRIR